MPGSGLKEVTKKSRRHCTNRVSSLDDSTNVFIWNYRLTTRTYFVLVSLHITIKTETEIEMEIECT